MNKAQRRRFNDLDTESLLRKAYVIVVFLVGVMIGLGVSVQ